jgi:hypothetical protein
MINARIQLVPGFSWFGKNIGIKDSTLDFGGILSDIPCQAAVVLRYWIVMKSLCRRFPQFCNRAKSG